MSVMTIKEDGTMCIMKVNLIKFNNLDQETLYDRRTWWTVSIRRECSDVNKEKRRLVMRPSSLSSHLTRKRNVKKLSRRNVK